MDVGTTLNMPAAGDDAAEKARLLQRRGAAAVAMGEKQRQQIKKTAQDFEGLFIGMMMKAMRETVGEDELTGGGNGEEIYRSLLDQEYVAQAVKRGGFGLAQQIEREIIRQESRRMASRVDIRK